MLLLMSVSTIVPDMANVPLPAQQKKNAHSTSAIPLLFVPPRGFHSRTNPRVDDRKLQTRSAHEEKEGKEKKDKAHTKKRQKGQETE